MPIIPEQQAAAGAIITLVSLVLLCLVVRMLFRCAKEWNAPAERGGKEADVAADVTLRTVAPGITKRFS